MPDEDIIATLRSFLASEFPRMRSKIEAMAINDSFTSSSMIDSIGMLTIVAFIERKWKFKLTSKEFVPQNFESLEQMRLLIEGKLGR